MLLADTHMASDTDAPKMTSQATRRALGIPELLEAILYHLPFQNLLRAQSVCKQWQTVIDHSKKLQRALYFEPVFWDHVALCEGRARCTPYSVDTNTAMQSLKGVCVTATGSEQAVGNDAGLCMRTLSCQR